MVTNNFDFGQMINKGVNLGFMIPVGALLID